VGDIIRFIEGPLDPVSCIGVHHGQDCPLYGDCAFMALWARARDAVASVYDSTTFQDLVDEEQARKEGKRLDYCI
jgi:DNA-binding IscR family transcriptional regulator